MQGYELVFFSKFSELKKCFYAPGKQLDFEGKLDFKKLGGGGIDSQENKNTFTDLKRFLNLRRLKYLEKYALRQQRLDLYISCIQKKIFFGILTLVAYLN